MWSSLSICHQKYSETSYRRSEPSFFLILWSPTRTQILNSFYSLQAAIEAAEKTPEYRQSKVAA
jgi:hypothetical protein